MKRTEIRGSCPYCYRRMIAATDHFGEEAPMHGDLAICKVCGEVSVFDFTRRKNTVRRPTWPERIAIEKNVSAIRLRQLQAVQGGLNGIPQRCQH
jgi:hypothetical protein